MSSVSNRCSIVLQVNTKLLEEQAVIDGVRRYAAAHQLPWDIMPMHKNEKYSRLILERVLPQGVFIGRSLPDEASGTPVAVYPWVRWGADATTSADGALKDGGRVCFDANAIGRVAVEYLRRAGARELAVVRKASSLDGIGDPTRVARIAAFCDNAEAVGLEVQELCPDRLDHEYYLQRLLDLRATLPTPIGVFCHNDLAAEWLINDLLHVGVQVPRDYLVLGGNGSAAASAARIALSSVRLPYAALGRAAAGLAHQLLNGIQPEKPCILIAPVVVDERASTAADKRSDDPLIKRALKRIQSKQPLPGVLDLARHCRCTRQLLYVHFRRELGCSPQQWLEQCAMQRAARLLVETDLDLAAIAKQCGFTHRSNVSKQFKKRFGISPTDYRRLEECDRSV